MDIKNTDIVKKIELKTMDMVKKQRFMEQLLVSFFISGKFACCNLINCKECCRIVHRFEKDYDTGVCCMGDIDTEEYKHSTRYNKIKEYCKKIYNENGMCLEIDENLNYTVSYKEKEKPKIGNTKGEIYHYQPSELVQECKIHYHNDNPYEVKYHTPGAVGCDVALPKKAIFRANNTFKIPLDISFEIPEGYFIEIQPRSSTLTKYNLLCTVGIIDTDYRGIVHFTGLSLTDYSLDAGTRVCQAILKKKYKINTVETVEQERNQNGFGGTGK